MLALIAINPFPSGDEVCAMVRSRLGAHDDVAAMDLAGSHAAYMGHAQDGVPPCKRLPYPCNYHSHAQPSVMLEMEPAFQQ